MSAADNAIEIVREQCFQRKIRLQEFCLTFTRGGVKKITKAQFQRAVDQANIKGLTQGDFEAIAEDFGSSDGYDIHYQRFCDKVDEAFTIKNLEKNPTDPFTTSYSGKSLQKIGSRLSNVEDVEVAYVLDKMRAKAKSEGIVFKMFFSDQDYNNDGSVTRQQFRRQIEKCLPNTLEEGEISLLIKKYQFGKYDVHYRQMHQDSVPEGAPGTGVQQPVTTVRKAEWKPSATTDADAVETKLMIITKQNRIRPKEQFQDFDSRRTGKVTRAQFLQKLFTLYGTSITATEMDQIADKYAVANSSPPAVSYAGFCAQLEQAFVTPGLEKNPMATSNAKAIFAASAPRRALNGLSSDQQSLYDQSIASLKVMVRTQRIDPMPTFQDFDPRREEHVTVTQFERAVNKVNLKDVLSARGWAVVFKKFSANDNRRNGEIYINYADFCAEITPGNGGAALGRAGRSLVSKPAAREVRSADQLLRDIAQKCKAEKIRIKDYFTDYDGLRKRTVSKARFLRALDLAKVLPFSTAEQDILCDRYAAGGGDVAYGSFEEDVDSASTVRGLEANPHLDVNATIASFDAGDYSSSADSSGASEVLRQLATRCATEGVELVPYFHDADMNNNGCLAYSVFFRVLTNRKLDLSEEQIALLASHYKARHTTGQATTRPDVNYRALCKAVARYDDSQPLLDSESFRRTTRNTTSSFGSTVVRKVDRPGQAVDIADTLRDLREYSARNSVRIKGFIAESDVLRSGSITEAKFRTAIAQLKLRFLAAEELDALVEYFRSDSKRDQVNWRKFVDALTPEVRLEDKPEASPIYVSQTIFRNQVEDQDTLEESLAKISNVCSQQRVHLKPIFQDYAKNNTRVLLSHNFEKVLDNMQIKAKADLSQKELDAVVKAFEVVEQGKGTNWVNFHEFVQRVDPSTEIC